MHEKIREHKAFLILENGKIFEGRHFGAKIESVGEIVFTTQMTGYLETLTDPSYYGQIVVQTFPLIGNYGVISSDFESKEPHVKAYIVRNWCQDPSNFRCEGDLDTFLKNKNIPGLYGIDTRELTRIVREYGVMNARICFDITDKNNIISELRGYKIIDAVKNVTCKEIKLDKCENKKYTVALWDFGLKENIRRELLKRGCDVYTIPSFTKAEDIIKLNPDGLMLSNGPGDPAENRDVIEELKKVCDKKIPIFGICLGHQLLALSQGARTEKLKYGHRGANQPAVDIENKRTYITSQNHGYAVVSNSLRDGSHMSYVNANDFTCEGVEYDYMPAFSVQFHPEASAGPLDTSFLFDKFISVIEKNRKR